MLDLPLTPTLLATPHRFLLHTPTNTAILSDLHLGIEHTMRQQGLAFPNINEQKIRESWSHLCDRLGDRGHIVVAGDLFDSPTPDPASLSLARDLINTLPTNITVTITPGNHDPQLADLRTLFDGTRASIMPSATVADHLIFHGDKWLANEAERGKNDVKNEGGIPPVGGGKCRQTTLIVGHQHPAVLLRSRLQSAKMICFAIAKIVVLGQEMRMILLPTFSRAPLGTNLITQAADSSWIIDCPEPTPANFKIAGIVEGRSDTLVLDFGTLADL